MVKRRNFASGVRISYINRTMLRHFSTLRLLPSFCWAVAVGKAVHEAASGKVGHEAVSGKVH